MKRLSLALCLVSLAACGEHPIDENIATTERITDRVCECGAELDPTIDRASCMANFEERQPTNAERACLRATFDEEASDADRAIIDCQLSALGQLASCANRVACSDAAGEEACTDAFDDANDRCGTISERLDDALGICDS